MLLVDQNGKEVAEFNSAKLSVKLQPIGAADQCGSTFHAVTIQLRAGLPMPVGIFRSRKMAELVARDLLEAEDEGKSFYQIPPSSISALELLGRILADE